MCAQKRNRNGSCSPCLLRAIHRPWEKGYKVYKCLQCENETKRESDLRRHVQIAHNSKNYKCLICHELFTRRDNLTRHKKSKHDENGQKQCPYCLKVISRNDAVKRHQLNCPQRPDESPASSPIDFSPKSPDINVVD